MPALTTDDWFNKETIQGPNSIENAAVIGQSLTSEFFKVNKINTNTIEFSCRSIISTDNFKSLSVLVTDFAKLISKTSNSKHVEVVFYEKQIIELFSHVHPK